MPDPKLPPRFEFIDFVDEGGHAIVYRVVDKKFDQVVALKILKNSEIDGSNSLKEIKKAVKLNHENIIRYLDFGVGEFFDGMKEYIVLEYANAGNLDSFIRSNRDLSVRKVIVDQILEAMNYLHGKGFEHGDLKPGNILLVEEKGDVVVKIADFGMAAALKGMNGKSEPKGQGTWLYAAPEKIDPSQIDEENIPPFALDMWAIGVIMYEIFTGENPFAETAGLDNPSVIAYKVLREGLPPKIDEVPEPYRSMVKACLVKEPKFRTKSVSHLIGIREKGVEDSSKKKSRPPVGLHDPVVEIVDEEKEAEKKEAAEKEKDYVHCPECAEKNKKKRRCCWACDHVLRGPEYAAGFQSQRIKSFFTIGSILGISYILMMPYLELIQQGNAVNGKIKEDKIELKDLTQVDWVNETIDLVLVLTIWIIGALLFASWVNRAHRNLATLNSRDTTWPSGAGGFLFALPLFSGLITAAIFAKSEGWPFIAAGVEILTLILPRWFMQEIWKGSNPALVGKEGKEWQASDVSGMINYWWIFSLLFPVSFILPIALSEEVGDKYVYSEKLVYGAVGVLGLCGLLTSILIMRINARQRARWKVVVDRLGD